MCLNFEQFTEILNKNMFSSIDVLSRNKDIYNVWHTGMSHDTLPKEEVLQADLKEIAKKLIDNKENIAFRLSAMIMKGAVVIYSKQATYVLMDCNDVIMRISLKYESIKKAIKGNKKEKKAASIDDETMAIWKQAQMNALDEEESSEEIEKSKKKKNKEVNENPENKENEQKEQKEEEDMQMDLGEAIDFNFSDEEDQQGPPIPFDDEKIEDEAAPSPQRKRLNRVFDGKKIDAEPLISIQEFMEKYHETIATYARPRQLRLPKNGVLVIADEIDRLFKEAYEVREEFIRDFPLPSVEDFDDVPIMPSEREVDADLDEHFDENEEKDNDESGSSLLSMVPEIQEALSDGKTISLSDMTLEFNMQKKAAAFYTTLALCTEGKLDLQQDGPDDPIFISPIEH